ncbi:MAG: FxsA family protein [Candidatus Pelagibacter sp.]
MNTLLLIILFIPLIEIYLFIQIGGQIGAFNTILFILLTAVVGVYFARLQGLNTLKSGITQLYRNQIPIYEMMSGAALALAALLLITPGFATDLIGFLLIFPITRNIFFKYLSKKYTKQKSTNEKSKDDLIEGEYEDKDN